MRKSQSLIGKYAEAAQGWQEGLARLGYPEAYAALFHNAPPAARHVLDMGTGSGGAFAEAFLQGRPPRPERLDLVDPVAEMLEVAQARLDAMSPATRVIRGGLGSVEVPEAGYDAVLCAHVVEHLDDPAGAVTWLASRVRPPGGRLYLSVSRPHWCTALLRWVWGGHRAYRPAQVTGGMLTNAGLAGTELQRYPKGGPPARTSCGYRAWRPREDRS